MFALRSRHYAVLHYVACYTSEQGRAPLLREIAAHFDLRIQTITEYVQVLEDRGLIERTPYKRRGIRVVEGVAA